MTDGNCSFSTVGKADMSVLRRAGPDYSSHVDNDMPVDDRRLNVNSRSCGVALLAVHSKERMECKASGSTICHCSTESLRALSANVTDFQITPTYNVSFSLAVTLRVIPEGPAGGNAFTNKKTLLALYS
ncbi:hypothetical protein M513_09029, partial [Trichuris suis]